MAAITFVVVYVACFNYLAPKMTSEDWHPFAAAFVPAIIAARFWRLILGLAVIAIVIILIAANNQN